LCMSGVSDTRYSVYRCTTDTCRNLDNGAS
jgi:hypothetical protein